MTSEMEYHSRPHLVVALHRSALGIRYDVSDNGTVINPTGFEYNVLTTLATVLNFSFILRDSSLKPYGTKPENGSWTGTVGEIARGEVDMALCLMSITHDRMEVVDYTPPYLTDNVAFFIKSQRMSEKKGIFFTEPFANETWILIFIALITYTQLLRVLCNPRCWLNSVTFVLANILHQGYNLQTSKNHRHRISTAIILVFWFFTSTIILIFYGSCLTSATSLRDTFSINTLKQLIPYFKRGELKIGHMPGSAAMDIAISLLDARRYRDVAMEARLDILTELMIKGKVAILVHAKYLILHLYERRLQNQYHLVKEWVQKNNIAMPIKKNFTYKGEFTRIINVLRDTGCLEKWETDLTFDFQRTERKKKLSQKDGYSPISSEDFGCVFILYLGGLLICFLIYNAERAINLYRDNRKNKMSGTTVETEDREEHDTISEN